MKASKVTFLLLVQIAFIYANFQNDCRKIMDIFYQTEDQYFGLNCSDPDKLESNVTLSYHCRNLQKKMDIFGKKYYDFQEWSAWTNCKDGKQIRFRESCTGRQQIGKQTCDACKDGEWSAWSPCKNRQKSSSRKVCHKAEKEVRWTRCCEDEERCKIYFPPLTGKLKIHQRLHRRNIRHRCRKDHYKKRCPKTCSVCIYRG